MLLSYIENKFFRVHHGREQSKLKQILAGVPQKSVLGSILYLLHTNYVLMMKMPQSLMIKHYLQSMLIFLKLQLNCRERLIELSNGPNDGEKS